MKSFQMVLATVLILFLPGCRSHAPRVVLRGCPSLAPERQRETRAIFRGLCAALVVRGEAGCVYYSGIPASGNGPTLFPWGLPVLFPAIRVGRPPKEGSGLAAAREMFRGDNCVVVQQGQGLVRVNIGRVSTAILGIRIPLLRLKRQDRYDAFSAILAVQDANRVRAAMRRLGWHLPPVIVVDYLLPVPKRGLPCLPAVMRDVTVGQVLDRIATTFKGIVLYGECKVPRGQHLFWIDFLGCNR